MGSWGCLFDGLGDEEEMGWGEGIVRSDSKRMSTMIDRKTFGLHGMLSRSVLSTGLFSELVQSTE